MWATSKCNLILDWAKKEWTFSSALLIAGSAAGPNLAFVLYFTVYMYMLQPCAMCWTVVMILCLQLEASGDYEVHHMGAWVTVTHMYMYLLQCVYLHCGETCLLWSPSRIQPPQSLPIACVWMIKIAHSTCMFQPKPPLLVYVHLPAESALPGCWSS